MPATRLIDQTNSSAWNGKHLPPWTNDWFRHEPCYIVNSLSLPKMAIVTANFTFYKTPVRLLSRPFQTGLAQSLTSSIFRSTCASFARIVYLRVRWGNLVCGGLHYVTIPPSPEKSFHLTKWNDAALSVYPHDNPCHGDDQTDSSVDTVNRQYYKNNIYLTNYK